jgi:diguanylate cyclase (GGDEF)-like protein
VTKVLAVDDATFQLRLLNRLLTDQGYEVLTAGCGEGALQAVPEWGPDVVLLDVTLPDVDGIEVCRRIKADPLTRPIPVIMVSARDRDDDVIRGLDAGAQDYVTKPFVEKILLARVRAAACAKADHDTIVTLNARLSELATADGLTGAKNRRYLQDALAQALSFSRRHRSPVSLAVLDVDRFKSHNDSFGHLAGDDVLRRLVAVVRGGLRAHDTIARYGGEEFIILMPATGADAAVAISERLRAAIAATPWNHRAVTASFGVATTASGDEAPDELLARADRALYRAKRTGRDRVVHDRDVNEAPAPVGCP